MSNMEERALSISLPKNPKITIEAISGHFATNTAHFNNYLDMTNLKSGSLMAREMAKELAAPYLKDTVVNTIVCMDKTEIIGAFLAEELGGEIYIVTPISTKDGKFIFQTNLLDKIRNRNIVLLVDSVSSGRTINRALECVDYYGGITVGISALFSAISENSDHDINAVFTSGDVPGYDYFTSDECTMCKQGYELDAIINSEGYTKIQ